MGLRKSRRHFGNDRHSLTFARRLRSELNQRQSERWDWQVRSHSAAIHPNLFDTPRQSPLTFLTFVTFVASSKSKTLSWSLPVRVAVKD